MQYVYMRKKEPEGEREGGREGEREYKYVPGRGGSDQEEEIQ